RRAETSWLATDRGEGANDIDHTIVHRDVVYLVVERDAPREHGTCGDMYGCDALVGGTAHLREVATNKKRIAHYLQTPDLRITSGDRKVGQQDPGCTVQSG